MTLPWRYGKSKEKDSGWMGDEGRLYHENGKDYSGACGILAGSACAGAALDRSGCREPEGTVVSVTEKQAMTFAEGEIRRIAGEGGPDCTWDDTTAILQGRPLYGPDDRCNGYVCRLTTGGMETGYLQVDALGGELCTGAYSFDGIPAYEGLAEEGGGTASEERLYFFGGISYGVRLEDGSFRLMGSPERVSAETAAEQYRHTVEQVQRQRAE